MHKAWATLVAVIAALSVAGCGLERLVDEGGPMPVSGMHCAGVPAAMCVSMRADAQRDAPPGAGAVVGIDIRCTTSCTEAAGDVTVVVTYANGQTVESGQGWASPVGTPGEMPIVDPTTLPVEPVCVGIDRERCLEFAAASLDAGPGGPVPVSIVVRCTAICDLSKGDGETVVRFADGTSRIGGWAYSSGDAQAGSPSP